MLLKLGYLGLTGLMTVLIALMSKKILSINVLDKKLRNKKLLQIVLGLVLWQTYQLALGNSGILTDFSLPPKFPFLLVFPAFLFIGIFLTRNRNKDWIMQIPETWLTYIQSFRILVETLFVYSVSAGVLHPIVTIEGYNFDMIFGISAIIMWVLVYKIKIINKSVLIYWNYIGLGILASVVFLFITSVYFPNLYNLKEMMPKKFATAPYILVAGFLMPLAVFIHILSLIRFSRNKNTSTKND